MSSLRTYAPQYEEDADEGDPRDPAAVPQHAFQQESAARHAALTEQAQRLMQQERPSVTDLRMYNMMMTRESILHVRVFYASNACCHGCVFVSKSLIRLIAAAEVLEQLRLSYVSLNVPLMPARESSTLGQKPECNLASLICQVQLDCKSFLAASAGLEMCRTSGRLFQHILSWIFLDLRQCATVSHMLRLA